MGLDMYLNAKRYFSDQNYSAESTAEKQIGESVMALIGGGPGTLAYIEVRAMYWRKSNQIHAWFVKNIQNGIDDCKPYYVDRLDLQHLRDLCRKVLVEREAAPALLPTRKGFFFGNTDYNQDYFNECQDTADAIDRLLDDKWKNWAFEYHASW